MRTVGAGLPLASAGVLLSALVMFLVLSGVFAELLLRVGGASLRRLLMLTLERTAAPASVGAVVRTEEGRRDA